MPRPEPETARRYCLYPYSLSGLSEGWAKITGMEALISREARLREHSAANPVTLICNGSPGDQPFELGVAKLTVDPVEADSDPACQANLLGVWFDELWALLHPAAFTAPGLSATLAKIVYPDTEAGPPGSFQRIMEHIGHKRSQRLADPEQQFADRFQTALDSIPATADIIWTEVFFTESILRCYPSQPTARHQTLHSFLVIPDSLIQTAPGRRILHALSKMDAVYLQTDTYLRHLGKQLQDLELPVPELHRFDLPPDSTALRRAVSEPPPSAKTIKSLDPHQRVLVQDAQATLGLIPHRFVCPDRLDPIKGIHVVIEAVDRFLTSHGQTLEQLQKRYRFYFVTDYYTRFPPVDRKLAWHRYADHIRMEQIPNFRARWPGIVHFADNIPDRFVWAHLLVDAHIISGGIQEGLGLAVQEGLVVNHERRLPRTVVMGNGAGFAIQAREEGLAQYGFFPTAGDSDAFTQALWDVVKTTGAIHLDNTSQLIERFIEPHDHRLLP